MRLDLYLKASRLIPRRPLAQKFCEAGLVSVNGAEAKSSRSVGPGDEIEIRRRDRTLKVTVISVPARKQVSKRDAADLYEVISETPAADDLFGGSTSSPVPAEEGGRM